MRGSGLVHRMAVGPLDPADAQMLVEGAGATKR